MELRTLCVERYKGYAKEAELDLAPLTILVGPNNSGKTAIAQAIQLFAGGLAPAENETSEPLPLESGWIRHGETFADLVTGRTVHGRLRIAATLIDDMGELSLSATVRNVMAPPRPSVRQVFDWHLKSGRNEIALHGTGFDDLSAYDVSGSGIEPCRRQISWRGLTPSQPNEFGDWAKARVDALRGWALGVRHLRCPRTLPRSPFVTSEHVPPMLGPGGVYAPLILGANDELRESVRAWYRDAFGETIDVTAQGTYSELVAGAAGQGTNIRLTQSGRGLSHVLPVVVMALTASEAGPGVDVIEHPEAELHPAAHANVAELLLESLTGPERPLVIETHSEMLLLRARRWVAEGRLSSDAVIIYWVHTEPGTGSAIRRIRIDASGDLDSWPDGVFVEDYEEILAIRHAARART